MVFPALFPSLLAVLGSNRTGAVQLGRVHQMLPNELLYRINDLVLER